MNLYKSAFYIGPEAIDELHEVIDIFSLSLKSMDPDFYRRVAKGRLEPVLEGIKQVYAYGTHHLEISNLVVTGMNDSLKEVEKVVNWMLKELDDEVPLHLVRFHPDYKYTHVERTNIEFLKKARLRALEMGIKHCYLGNVYEEHEGLNTSCRHCGNLLVQRFGLQTKVLGINSDQLCSRCGKPTPITFAPLKKGITNDPGLENREKQSSFSWHQDINACHVVIENKSLESQKVICRQDAEKVIPLEPGEQWRFICSRQSQTETGVELWHSPDVQVHFAEVLDRAHYPV
ncbi:hypothetical protein EBQ90_03165 [bacterium]|nr:hypothetical protein [bacterium]